MSGTADVRKLIDVVDQASVWITHLHLQAGDSANFDTAQGLPVIFDTYHEWSAGAASPRVQRQCVPRTESIVHAMVSSDRPHSTTNRY